LLTGTSEAVQEIGPLPLPATSALGVHLLKRRLTPSKSDRRAQVFEGMPLNVSFRRLVLFRNYII
jgi:hypothetical protein